MAMVRVAERVLILIAITRWSQGKDLNLIDFIRPFAHGSVEVMARVAEFRSFFFITSFMVD